MKNILKSHGFLAILVAIILAAPLAKAKDLTHRLGIGYTDQFSQTAVNQTLPSLSVRYYPQADLGFAASLGVQTDENNSKFGLNVKLIRIIFPEERMNFYMGASAGLLSTRITNVNNSGFELVGFCGAEFFIPDLDSLGFSFEAGVGITSVSNGVSFRTIGDSPLRAGMIFYF